MEIRNESVIIFGHDYVAYLVLPNGVHLAEKVDIITIDRPNELNIFDAAFQVGTLDQPA